MEHRFIKQFANASINSIPDMNMEHCFTQHVITSAGTPFRIYYKMSGSQFLLLNWRFFVKMFPLLSGL